MIYNAVFFLNSVILAGTATQELAKKSFKNLREDSNHENPQNQQQEQAEFARRSRPQETA